MHKTIAIAGALALLALTGPASAQSQMQQPSPSMQMTGNAQFCLKPKATGAVNCTYQTLAQCQQASNKGNEGDCITNPKMTTGSGSQPKQ